MEPNDIMEKIECWLEDSIDIEEAPDDGFYVEKYEHAAVIRWGSKRGDFPRIGHSPFSDESYFILSGTVVNENIMAADTDAKAPIDVEQLAYKHFLETLMKDDADGYEIETKPLNGKVFKIRVERIDPTDQTVNIKIK